MKTLCQGKCNESLKLLKSAERYFYPSFSSVWVNLSSKKSFLVRSEILGLLVTKFTGTYKYSRSNTDKVPLPVQMQLSETLGTFSGIFIPFFKSALNFEHFPKKSCLRGQVSLKLITPKNVFTYIHKSSCFWKLFGSERVNKSLKLPKTA